MFQGVFVPDMPPFPTMPDNLFVIEEGEDDEEEEEEFPTIEVFSSEMGGML